MKTGRNANANSLLLSQSGPSREQGKGKSISMHVAYVPSFPDSSQRIQVINIMIEFKPSKVLKISSLSKHVHCSIGIRQCEELGLVPWGKIM